jgi:hypothetical protein
MAKRPLHLDIDAAEKDVRQAIADFKVSTDDPITAIALRAGEVQIQWMLYLLREINNGTDPGEIVEACSHVMASMLLNVDLKIGSAGNPPSHNIWADIYPRLKQGALATAVEVKITGYEGGNA